MPAPHQAIILRRLSYYDRGGCIMLCLRKISQGCRLGDESRMRLSGPFRTP